MAGGVPLDDEHRAEIEVPELDAAARRAARDAAMAAAAAWLARGVDDEQWWIAVAGSMSPAAQRRYAGSRPGAGFGSAPRSAELTGRSTGWLAYVDVATDGRPLEVLLSRHELGGWLVERIGPVGEIPR